MWKLPFFLYPHFLFYSVLFILSNFSFFLPFYNFCLIFFNKQPLLTQKCLQQNFFFLCLSLTYLFLFYFKFVITMVFSSCLGDIFFSLRLLLVLFLAENSFCCYVFFTFLVRAVVCNTLFLFLTLCLNKQTNIFVQYKIIHWHVQSQRLYCTKQKRTNQKFLVYAQRHHRIKQSLLFIFLVL